MQSAATLTKEEIYQKKPEELTLLLYQALERNIKTAALAIEQRDMSTANAKLKRANDIVERLGAGINYEAGIIADQLHVIYEYLADKLIIANMTKSVQHCEEALQIVNRITDGWQHAMTLAKSGTTPKPRKLSYEEQVDFSNSDKNCKRFDIKN